MLNPRSKKGKWKYKSNNKTITSYLLGMPVASDVDDLKRFVDPDKRQKEADEKRKWAMENYNVEKSVAEYKNLIKVLKNDRKII